MTDPRAAIDHHGRGTLTNFTPWALAVETTIDDLFVIDDGEPAHHLGYRNVCR